MRPRATLALLVATVSLGACGAGPQGDAAASADAVAHEESPAAKETTEPAAAATPETGTLQRFTVTAPEGFEITRSTPEELLFSSPTSGIQLNASELGSEAQGTNTERLCSALDTGMRFQLGDEVPASLTIGVEELAGHEVCALRLTAATEADLEALGNLAPGSAEEYPELSSDGFAVAMLAFMDPGTTTMLSVSSTSLGPQVEISPEDIATQMLNQL